MASPKPLAYSRLPCAYPLSGQVASTERPWTILKKEGLFELWRQDRPDPAGSPIVIYRGTVFMMVGGERRQTPEQPTFTDLAKAEAWFNAKVGGDVE